MHIICHKPELAENIKWDYKHLNSEKKKKKKLKLLTSDTHTTQSKVDHRREKKTTKTLTNCPPTSFVFSGRFITWFYLLNNSLNHWAQCSALGPY